MHVGHRRLRTRRRLQVSPAYSLVDPGPSPACIPFIRLILPTDPAQERCAAHLDGEELLVLLEEHHEGRPRAPFDRVEFGMHIHTYDKRGAKNK
mgnify:CR=1 FL=1